MSSIEGYRSVGLARLIAGVRHRWHNGRADVPDRQAVREMAEQMLREQVAA